MAAMTRVSMVAWERGDWAPGSVGQSRGHSVARRERLECPPGGWLFHASEILVGEETLSCTFSVLVGPGWVTRRVEASSVSGAGQRRRVLEATDRGWTVDGTPRPDLDGCVDVDVAATPLTNTFPIRRLAHLRVGESVTSGVAWVDVPALGVTRVEQTYERLDDRDGLARWRYSDPAHGAFVLTVDDEGLVVDFEGFARRIPTTSPTG
jgi:uncharacterized protein